jgi:hypothetical protein
MRRRHYLPPAWVSRHVSLKKAASTPEERHSLELSLLQQKEKDLYRYTVCPTLSQEF